MTPITTPEMFDQLFAKWRADKKSGWQDDWRYRGRESMFEQLLQEPYFPKGRDLLELGCGNGVMGLWFSRRGFNIHGFDISPEALDWANENARHIGATADFRQGDIAHPDEPFKGMTFDFVFDGDSTQYLGDADWPAFYRRIGRILRPGGLFWLGVELPNDNFRGEYHDGRWHYRAGDRTAICNNLSYRVCVPKEYAIQEAMDAGFQILGLKEFSIRDWDGYPKEESDDEPPFFSNKSMALSLSRADMPPQTHTDKESASK